MHPKMSNVKLFHKEKNTHSSLSSINRCLTVIFKGKSFYSIKYFHLQIRKQEKKQSHFYCARYLQSF